MVIRHSTAATARTGITLSLGSILLCSLAVRTVFAMLVPLTTDETYALTVARSYSISFFDHPPLGFWLPALSEAILGDSYQIIYRLPALIFGTGVLWLFYKVGDELGGESVGLWTAGLAALTPAVLIYGTVVLPDTPLEFFMLATVLILLRLVRNPDAPLWFWALGGAMLALALASKYQAGLIPISVLIWAAITPAGRGWFTRPGFYLAVVVALIGLVPVVWWNAGHDWASFRFHSDRPGDGISLLYFAGMTAAQALFLLPLFMIWALAAVFARANWADPQRRLLVLIALGPIVMFNLVYLRGGDSYPHWTMPGYICLIPLVATGLAAGMRGWRAHLWTAGALYALILIVALHLTTGILTRFATTQPDWDRTAPNISITGLRQVLNESGYLQGRPLLAAESWGPGGRIGAAMRGMPVRILGEDTHHFAYLPSQSMTGPALFLDFADWQIESALTDRMLALARRYDPNAELLPSLHLGRMGQDQFRIIAIALTLP